MKKDFLKVVAVALSMVSLASCAGKGEPTDSVIDTKDFDGIGYLSNDYFALKQTNKSIEVGENYQLIIDSLPRTYSLDNLKFTSKDEKVAKVSSDGIVSGIGKGITDIVIKSDDGKVDTVFHVLVGEKGNATTVINNIKEAYADPSHEPPTKFFLREYDKEVYSCQGIEQYGYESFETMAFDYDKGYFMVQSEDLTLRTANGVKEKASGKWIFYTINQGQFLRFIHITETGRRFFEVNTSDYLNEGDVIYDALDMFFASGRKIVTNMLDNIENGDFDYMTSKSPSNLIAGNSQMSYIYTEEGKDQKVDAEDELEYYDIPCDTIYDYYYEQSCIQNGDRCEASNVDMIMTYELDGKPWSRQFTRSMSYSDEFELEKYNDPEHNGFTKVDNIYDL